MNYGENIQLIPASPILDRLTVLESRLSDLEKENLNLRHSHPEKKYATRESARQQLNCGMTKLHELIKAGEIKAFKMGRKTLITQESIDRCLIMAQTNKNPSRG